MKAIEFYDEGLITKQHWKTAYELCQDVDLKDIPFVALTLELNGRLWSGDEALKDNLGTRGFHRFYALKGKQQ